MKSNIKSSITLPPNELKIVLSLMKSLGLKSKVEVIRKGLQLLQNTTERNRLKSQYASAAAAVGKHLKTELSELDALSSEGLDSIAD